MKVCRGHQGNRKSRCAQEQSQLVAATFNEYARGGVDQNDGAEHVQCQQCCEEEANQNTKDGSDGCIQGKVVQRILNVS